MRCTAALLSRIYVFAAFDGRWPGVTFLILALGPIAPGKRGVWEVHCGRADQGPEMKPRSRSRLVERDGGGRGWVRVGEHGWARVRLLTWGG